MVQQQARPLMVSVDYVYRKRNSISGKTKQPTTMMTNTANEFVGQGRTSKVYRAIANTGHECVIKNVRAKILMRRTITEDCRGKILKEMPKNPSGRRYSTIGRFTSWQLDVFVGTTGFIV
jgi:hypothetical protein